MTLFEILRDDSKENMDDPTQGDKGKSLRPVRSRRYTRRSFITGQRPQKRLFTPEIKRYLKDWLVRRRDNPYPNREEKKVLSRETGLTYVQICNWFANWRRKLKNVNTTDMNQLTWGHLIRTYNDRAQGNVEQFSIGSDDSIWSEPESQSPQLKPDHTDDKHYYENSSDATTEHKDGDTDDTSRSSEERSGPFNNNCNEIDDNKSNEELKITGPLLLTKWLESAARFKPRENNYLWWADEKRKKSDAKMQKIVLHNQVHDRDEVEAAMALTTLAASRITV
ncbi:iroquois-class homeodomain protein irx-3 [Leptidea sinapis]|uniref:iroquois-class homeodomain protein irx-3 n=1 Tax=Leptidea sinapis TaxID=189913 RepID=UPI00213CE965|nr:iroquois-class homeodomain protein irx-3 [Leptidea sinapis]